MTQSGHDGRPRSVAIRYGGAVIDGASCEALWRFLRPAVTEHERAGAQLRPEMREAVEAIRLAAMDHLAMSAAGHVRGHRARLEPLSDTSVVTTAEFAQIVGVVPRQVLRLAASNGLAPLARNAWRRTDALSLATDRQQRAS